MSSTNKTANLGLSQFVQSDHATWYVDYNSDMLKIDNAYNALDQGQGGLAETVETNSNDISVLKTNVNGLQNGLNSTNVTLQQTQGRVTTLETEYSAIDTRVEKLEDDVSNLMNVDEWVIVGDSYAVGDIAYFPTLQQCNPNRTLHNVSASGAGFTPTGNNFLLNLQNYVSNITNLGRVQKVVAMGGYNDQAASGSTILTAINAFIQYCIATFPNAEIYIGYCCGQSTQPALTTKEKTLCAYIEACRKGEATFISGMENLLLNYAEFFVGRDGVHPNQAGMDAIAYNLNSFLRTGAKIDVQFASATDQITNIDNPDVTYTGSGIQLLSQVNNDQVYLAIPATGVTLTKDIESFAWFTIGEFPIRYANPASLTPFPVTGLNQTQNKLVNLRLNFANGLLKAYPYGDSIASGDTVAFNLEYIGYNATLC